MEAKCGDGLPSPWWNQDALGPPTGLVPSPTWWLARFRGLSAHFLRPSSLHHVDPIAYYNEYRFRGSGTFPPIQMYPTYVVLFHSLIKLLLADLVDRKFAGRPCDTYNIELVYELISSTVQRLRQHEVIP